MTERKIIIPSQPELAKTILKEKETKTLGELKKELEIKADFSLPEGLDDGDIVEITIKELNNLKTQITENQEKKEEIFKKFLETKREQIKAESKEGMDRLKSALEIARKAKSTEQMINISNNLEKIPLIGGILAGIFKFIFGFFGFNFEKIENEVGKIRETAETTKESVVRGLESIITRPSSGRTEVEEKKLNGIIKNPILQGNINKALNDKSIFSDEAWKKIETAKNEGKEINWKFLSNEILNGNQRKKLLETILDSSGREVIRLQLEKDLVASIEEKYHLKLTREKREDLVNLLKEYNPKMNYEKTIEKIMEGKPLTGFDLVGASLGTGASIIWFSFKLIAKGIISISDIAMKSFEGGLKMIKFMTPFGVGEVSLAEYKKELEGKSEVEKGIQLGLLYRESGLFFDLISGALGLSSRLLFEIVTPGSSGFKAMYEAGFSKFEKQAANFEELQKSIIGDFGEKESAITQVKDRLLKLSKYYKIADILREAEKTGETIELTKSKLLALGISENSLITGINKATTFDELRTGLYNNINDFGHSIRITYKSKLAGPILDGIKANTWNGFSKSIEDFDSNSRNVLKYIKSRISGGEHWYMKIIRGFGKKESEILASLDLGRNLDKLVIEGTKTEQLTKIQALTKLSQDFPEFFKTLFPGITGITCIGLAFATSEEGESWTKTAIESLMIMSRGLGPMSLILNSGAMYDKDTNQLQWINVAQSGVGTVLLGVDVLGYAKIWQKSHSITDFILKSGKYSVSPITDMGKFVLNGGKMVVNIKDVIKSKATLKETINSSKLLIEKGTTEVGPAGKGLFKSRAGKVLVGLGALLTAGGAYAYKKYNSFENDFEELQNHGILDENWILKKGKEDEAKKWFNGLSDGKKARFIELVFSTQQHEIEPAGNIDFKYNDGKVYAYSKNPIIGEWVFLDPNIESYLRSFGFEGKINFQQKTTS